MFIDIRITRFLLGYELLGFYGNTPSHYVRQSFFFFFFKEASLYIVLVFETIYLMAVIILENIFTFQLAIRVVAFVLLMMLLASPLCIAIRAHQSYSDRISQIAFIERDQLIDDSNQLDAEKIYVRRDSAGCGCTKFLHRMGHVSIHGRAKHGLSLCAGMLSPKLYTKCGRPLGG
jgi:hypothetical protein